MKRAALVGLLLLSACTAHQPIQISSVSLGAGQEEVLGITSGSGKKTYFMIFGGFAPLGVGDDSYQAARRDALQYKPGAHTLVNVFADRRCTFVPHPLLALWVTCETVLTGTAIRYTKMPAETSSQAAAPVSLKGIANSEVFRRLVAMERATAQESLEAMDQYDREVLTEHILATKGAASKVRWKFEISRSLGQKDRDFVMWYLTKYSSYKPQ